MGLIENPTMIVAAGNPPKQIAEYVGRLNTKNATLSIALMVSPGGGTSLVRLPSLMNTLWYSVVWCG